MGSPTSEHDPSDIDPAIRDAALETIETCAQLAEGEEHGDLGRVIANKIRGLAVFARDTLAGNYMLRDGVTESEAVELANSVRAVLRPSSEDSDDQFEDEPEPESDGDGTFDDDSEDSP